MKPKTQEQEEFLRESLFGAILRFFVSDFKEMEDRVSTLMETIRKLISLEVNGIYVYSRIDVLIPSNKDYPDVDCGHSANYLRSLIADEPTMRDVVYVTEEDKEIFVSLINHGLALQRDCGVSHHTILSTQAHSYLNTEMLVDTIDGFREGAKLVPMKLYELADSIGQGEGTNTCCTWDSEALERVGDFDDAAAQLKKGDEPVAYFIDPESNEKKPYKGGVEELPSIKRMVDLYGQCIRVIEPKGTGIKQYELPAEGTPARKRNDLKMETKNLRKDALMKHLNLDRPSIKEGLM